MNWVINNMKDSLVNLLFEEFKQECLFEELEQKGIDLTKVSVQIYDIVLDLIGFPKDNTKDYDFNALNGLEHNPKLGKLPDDVYVVEIGYTINIMIQFKQSRRNKKLRLLIKV